MAFTVYKKGILHGCITLVFCCAWIPTHIFAYTELKWIEDKRFLPDDARPNFAGVKKPYEPKLSLLFEEDDDLTKSKDITPINIPLGDDQFKQRSSKVKVIVEAVKFTPKGNQSPGHQTKNDMDRVGALDWKQQIAKAFEESDVISFTALIGLTLTCLICIIFLIYRCRKSHKASKMENCIDTLAYDKSSLSVIELTRQPDIRDFFHSHT